MGQGDARGVTAQTTPHKNNSYLRPASVLSLIPTESSQESLRKQANALVDAMSAFRLQAGKDSSSAAVPLHSPAPPAPATPLPTSKSAAVGQATKTPPAATTTAKRPALAAAAPAASKPKPVSKAVTSTTEDDWESF